MTKEYPSEELKSSPSTNSTSADFLYPKLVGNPAYIDGIAEGQITLFNDSSNTTVTIDDYTVTLYKTDNVPSNETQIGTYSQTISSYNILTPINTIWTVANGGNDDEDTLVLPVYMPISKKKIDVDEKLYLHIEFSTTSSTNIYIGHYNGTDPDDIKLNIPYAATG